MRRQSSTILAVGGVCRERATERGNLGEKGKGDPKRRRSSSTAGSEDYLWGGCAVGVCHGILVEEGTRRGGRRRCKRSSVRVRPFL
jgi:hypothetical protein